MRSINVVVGQCYAAKVSGKVVSVRIDRTNPYGGWDGTNTVTGRAVRIKSAAKLRYPIGDEAARLAYYERQAGPSPSGAAEPGTEQTPLTTSAGYVVGPNGRAEAAGVVCRCDEPGLRTCPRHGRSLCNKKFHQSALSHLTDGILKKEHVCPQCREDNQVTPTRG